MTQDSPLRSGDAAAVCNDDQLDTISCAKLGQWAAHVGLDGLGDEERTCDFGIRAAQRHEVEDFLLPGREALKALCWDHSGSVQVFGDESLEHGVFKGGIAGGH